MVCEFLGISPIGSGSVPADRPRQGRRGARRRASWSWTCCAAACGRAQILTRDAFENAIAAVAATGGSTNAVLHLLAIAREAGRAARHRRLRSRSARRCRCWPTSSRAAASSPPTSTRAGGIAARRAAAARGRAARTATPSRSPAARIGEEAGRRDRDAGPGGRAAARSARQADRRPGDPARQPRARRLRGQGRRLRRARHHRGPARVFDSEEAGVRRRCSAGSIKPGDVVVIRYEGPARRARACARCSA